MPAATPRILFVLSLHAPVALRRPDQQPKPDGHAEQADDGTEEYDNGHSPIIAEVGVPRSEHDGIWPASGR